MVISRLLLPLLVFGSPLVLPAAEAGPAAPRPNLILILSDDHRWDWMGFMPEAPAFLETPHLNRLAREGAHLRNAFVSTSLCSPSRASILTGQYLHHHGVVDNQRPEAAGIRFFPEYLQAAGYATAFFGKWHMGHDSDEPRKGYNHWAGFRGQGEYTDPTLNINGQRRKFTGYSTDVLTTQAIEWLQQRRGSAPFFVQLAFKAPHFPFEPAPRNLGRYANAPVRYPPTMANTEENYATQPRWVRERRYGIHGVDHMETGRFDQDPVPSFPDLFRRYSEAVFTIDENIGRLLQYLDTAGLGSSTLIVYLGDNGFALGEHGFYDKRDAYETSIRVPMLAWAPGRIQPGTVVRQMVQNIDLAATFLEVAGVKPPPTPRMDGASFWPLLQGRTVPWRDHLIYEYHWEWNFPATPTLFALRTERWKYVYHHGIWDLDALYDLQTDPIERHNLIQVPAFREQATALRQQLFDELEKSGALQVTLPRPAGDPLHDRKLTR